MPSILGSAELKFAKKAVGFTSNTFSEVALRVREPLLYRKLYLSVIPNGGTFEDYAWTGTVEFRLKGNSVETWKVGFKDTGGIDPTTDFPGETVQDVVFTPPYWIETFTAVTAQWPVTAPSGDEQTVLLDDTNTTDTKYHVHMLPIEFTGHFDELVFRVRQAGTLLTGEKNSYLVVGCLSQPLAD
jgi:hypothetical protein